MSPLTWALLFVASVPLASAIFFGGGGGDCGGCQQSCCAAPPPPPPCPPPPPPCPPPPPPQPCGCQSYGGGGYAQPQQECPPRYIIIRSSSGGIGGGIGGGSIGGGSYSAGPVGGGGYAAGPAPVVSSYQSGGSSYQQSAPQPAPQPVEQPQQQQVAAPSPPTDSDYTESNGAAAEQKSASYQENAQVAASPTSTENPTYNTQAREYAAKTFNATARCQNAELLELLQLNIIEGDAKESKRRVFKIVNEIFSSTDEKPIDVICAPSKISYRLTADLSCEYTKGETKEKEVTCVAFKQA
ncbi:hypothetical protein M3Y99_00917500 [Aphelenchoides fujianensis]|nr:hypothetical protein M3Y99_00917500 [Aphelenchoides fujianensis]